MAFESIANISLILSKSLLWPSGCFKSCLDGSLMCSLWHSSQLQVSPSSGLPCSAGDLCSFSKMAGATTSFSSISMHACLYLHAPPRQKSPEQCSRGLPLTSELISHPPSHRMSPLHFLLPVCLPRCSGHDSWKAKQKEHSDKHAWPHFPLCISFYFSHAFLSQITSLLTKPLHTHYHRMLSSCSLSSVSTILGVFFAKPLMLLNLLFLSNRFPRGFLLDVMAMNVNMVGHYTLKTPTVSLVHWHLFPHYRFTNTSLHMITYDMLIAESKE